MHKVLEEMDVMLGQQRVVAMKAACMWLRERKVKEVVHNKGRLVEVPYTATLSHTMNVLLANDIAAVPVAAPPNRWIGAGGSMILESDPVTGIVRKQYIGIVTMLDVLVHIAEEDGGIRVDVDHDVGDAGSKLDRRMSVPVSSIIGHSLEGLSLWTLSPNTRLLDCMETFSKGVHRALIPLESSTDRDHVVSVELAESSPGYRMLTQKDVLSFLKSEHTNMKDVMSCTVQELGAINDCVFSITKYTKVFEAIKSMRSASVSSVPIVESVPGDHQYDNQQLLERKRRKLLGTFSATDLRSCSVEELQKWMATSVVEFKAKSKKRLSLNRATTERSSLVTCFPETTLSQVIEEAVSMHVHRVWVVDADGLLTGLVSLTDMLRVIRANLLVADSLPEG